MGSPNRKQTIQDTVTLLAHITSLDLVNMGKYPSTEAYHIINHHEDRLIGNHSYPVAPVCATKPPIIQKEMHPWFTEKIAASNSVET